MGLDSYIVVGAGIVGLATAREIHKRRPDATVMVVDKELTIAAHQTSHNSGVVHAGIYYEPGSLKARLCVRGRTMLQDFCAEHDLAYEECGKVVVARNDEEIPRLRAIEARARANGVPGIRWLDSRQLSDIEPHATGLAGVHSPHTAVVDFFQVATAMADRLDVRLGFEVTAIHEAPGRVTVSGPAGDLTAGAVVLCAGLQSDRVAQLAGDGEEPAIVPFRGEYWRLVPERTHLVRGLIYPVPDPRYPFLGVHFTRRVGGAVDLGPNAVLALAREGYRRSDANRRDVASTLVWPGSWRMARQHWRAGIREIRSSLSKAAFVREAQTLVPAVRASDVVRAASGVRAQAVDADGRLVDDFRISRCGRHGQIVAVRNAPSPAATSSLAIAEHIVDRLLDEPKARS